MKKGLGKFYDLVDAFENLPTIGRKSALRLAYHIIMNNSFSGVKIAHAIDIALKHIKKCKYCGFISEHEICEICLDDYREKSRLCIVQNAKDIFTIEESKQFDGLYFVVDELSEDTMQKLMDFVKYNEIKEVLFAITPSISNDTFIIYIEDKLQNLDLIFSKIAQGVPTGVKLEDVDILSLSKAIQSRVSV